MKRSSLFCLSLMFSGTALAQTAVDTVVVTARWLDQARSMIEPQLGASVTSFSAQGIRDLPSGADTKLDLMLVQAPGVPRGTLAEISIHRFNPAAECAPVVLVL